jgi:formylglycine-generating enzyme required for sulfatase activity
MNPRRGCRFGLIPHFFVATLLVVSVQADVYETSREFLGTGDFNGDGAMDVVLIDKPKGRIRVGYSFGGGIFDWPDWRDSGSKDLTGVTIGKLFDTQRDAVAVTSSDVNLVGMVDLASATKPTDPVAITADAQGPNQIFALDIPGDGNTPLDDVLLPSVFNASDNPLKVTVLRNTGGKLTTLAEMPTTFESAHGKVITLKEGGKRLAASILKSSEGVSLCVGTIENGKLVLALSVPDVAADADFVLGNFTGSTVRQIVTYVAGTPDISFHKIEEKNGSFESSAAKTFTLSNPVHQLAVVNTGKRSQLLAVFGTNQPAELLNFDGESAPVKTAELWGATNKFLYGAISTTDAILLISAVSDKSDPPATHYSAYRLKDGVFIPGGYGSLPTLDDRDDSTVPAIHERIVAGQKEKSAAEMKTYTNTIPGTDAKYSMVAIPGGEFIMGSPASEPNRNVSEGPQHAVKVSPFWIGQFEVTWDQFTPFMYRDDEKKMREQYKTDPAIDEITDAVTRPSKPYVDMSFSMGKPGFPAIAMTQHSANKFCHWLSGRTGHFYRLPTEAEWEFACRAGSTNAFYFGDNADDLPKYAWFFDNSNDKYQRIGKKLPNAWGLYDMLGNVREWTLDQFAVDFYATSSASGMVVNPWNKAAMPYPHSTRGGSWFDDAANLRNATRIPSGREWKMTDPQLPKSRWWLSDAKWIGIRLVRPLEVPAPEVMVKYWTSGVDKE